MLALAVRRLVEGNSGVGDLLAFAPAVGYAGGKAGQAVGLLSKNCFVAGTLVAVGLEDGQIIARPIEAIAVGDTVLARSELDPEGPLEERRVSQVFVRTTLALQRVTIVQPDGTSQTLQTTPEHPFYVEGRGWIEAKDLRPGDLLLTPEGGHEAVAASELELHPEGVRVYNFEVEGAHTYFVDADTAVQGGVVWVHNANYATGSSAAATSTLGKYSVGRYENLAGVVPGLQAHHVGQKSLMRRFVSGYDVEKAPAILVPAKGHTTRSLKEGIVSRSMSGFSSARQVVARDIRELRRVYKDIPNAALKEIVQLNKTLYALAMKRRNK